MKIVYLPINDYKNIGGPTTFVKNLSKYFTDKNISYEDSNHNNAQSILFPISYSKSVLKKYKKQNKPIIQRLDGLSGFPWQRSSSMKSFFTKMRYENTGISLKHQVKYMLDMFQIGNIYNNYSDLIIFQSKYCRDLCFDMMKPLPEEKYKIIYNGAHTDIFYPSTKLEISSCPEFVITGRFRRNDMLLPVFDALDVLNRKYDFKLKIIGPIEKEYMLEEAKSRSYVTLCGPMTREGISKELRKSDIYIFASLNAPCPNALLEAIATGLPIVSYNYGSISELLSFSPDLIAETKASPNPLLKSGLHLSAEALAEKLELTLNQFSKYKNIAIENNQLFSFDKCGDQYLSAVQQQVTNKLI
jgi:glycosyltransferase involved in cell wall biosynthesis